MRQCQLPLHALGHPGGVAHVFDRFDEDCELVSTKPAHRVPRPQTSLEPAGHRRQELVPRQVAQGVVDGFETIEGDEEHRKEGLALTPGAGHGLGEPLQEECPVG